ncbi:MAG: hypothetical protein ACRCWI_00665 [Brevinema sp.]
METRKETKIERFLNLLIKKRIIVFAVLAGVLVLSFLAGYLHQTQVNKNREANILFDDTWQKIYAIVAELQARPNQIYETNNPTSLQIKNLYQQALNDLEILTTDYVGTTAGVRAALLIQTVLPLSNLNSLLDDQTILASLGDSDYLESIKREHPGFWGAVLAMVDGINAEQRFDFAAALDFYRQAMDLDKKKLLRDYIIIAIARNNEVLGNKEQAIEYYQMIELEYPDSVWLSFAMGKAYLLSQQSSSEELTLPIN